MTTTSVTAGVTSSGITLNSGDFLDVSSGGTVNDTVINKGGTAQLFSGGVASLTMVSKGGIAMVFAGGVAGFTMVSRGGSARVLSGGLASLAVVSGGGTQTVASGGVASGTFVANGGIELVMPGGIASNGIVSGGSEYISGRSIDTVLSAGNEYVYAGAVTMDNAVSGRGKQFVFSAGVASSTVLTGGAQFLFSAGLAVGTLVDSGGVQQLNSAGMASRTVVLTGGQETVQSGGIAKGTLVSGGTEVVFGQVSATVLNGGNENVFAGGVASGTVVRGVGSILFAHSGGQVIGAAVSSGGQEVVQAGGATTGTTVSAGGTLVVDAGGTAQFIVVSRGGSIDFPNLVFSSGGTASVGVGDLLTVTEGAGSATLSLSGQYQGQVFQTAQEPNGGSGTVVTLTGADPPPGPRELAWIGVQDTNFANAADWNDLTNGLVPASTGPNQTDSVTFLTGGGTITGDGTAAALAFGGIAAWEVTSGASLAATGVTVGQGGIGTLKIDGGASISGLGGADDISGLSGEAASVTVDGAGTAWKSAGALTVGNMGTGALTVINAAHVSAAAMALGVSSSGNGSVLVDGAGSQLLVTGLLDVGVAGAGLLELGGGATVTAGSLDAGNVAGALAQIGLSGSGTNLIIANAATVADDGTGILSVLSGATFTATSLTIGNNGNSSGALVVSGTGSLVNLSGALNIGTVLGAGDLTVGPGAAIHASVVNLRGQVVLEGGLLDPTVNLIGQGQTAGGYGTISAEDIIDEGVIQAGGNGPSQKLLIVQGAVAGGGTLTVNGTVLGSNPAGELRINAGGTMELTGPVLNAATTTFADNLTPVGTYTINNSVIDVTFADAAGVLQLDDIVGFGGTISTYHTGDAFVITGGTLSGLGVSNETTLMVHDSGAGAGTGGIDSIIFGSAIDPATLSIVNGNTIVACFAAGTRIETVAGPMAVEALAVGDRVVTIDGASEPIIWLGSRAVNCRSHPAPETVWPVRIARGAFGDDAPSRDLFVSPDHAIYVDDVLIPAKHFVNGVSVRQVRRRSVVYHHVELARHDVISAEGLPVETYLDVGDRANFSGGRVTALHPEFSARTWEAEGCAPLIVTGPILAAARARLLQRAKEAVRRGKWRPRAIRGRCAA